MAQYNLPEDINNEMIDEIIAQLEELDPELFQIIKMMGDVGKHVFYKSTHRLQKRASRHHPSFL